MIVKIFQHSFRITKFCLETMAVLATVAVLAAAILFWRLSQGPFDVSFAQSYIEAALSDRETGFDAKLPNLILSWPELRGPLVLQAKNVAVLRSGQTVFKVAQARIGLSTLYLFTGQIVPVSIELAGPALQLIRESGDHFTLGLSTADTTQLQNAGDVRELLRTLARSGWSNNPLAHRSPLEHLRLIRIADARLAVEDRMRGVTWYAGHLDFAFARTWQGLSIDMSAPLPGGRGPDASIRLLANYHRATDDFDVTARFHDLDPRLFAQTLADQWPNLPDLSQQNLYLDGNAQVSLNRNLQVTAGTVQVTADQAVLDLPAEYTHGLALDHATVTAHYDRAAGRAALDDLTVQTAGITATLAAPFILDTQGAHGNIALLIPELPQSAIAKLWPDQWPTDSTVRRWLVEKMTGGVLRNIQATAALDLVQQTPGVWQKTLRSGVADFDLEDMNVDYRAPLAPALDLTAHGHYADAVFDLAIKRGTVGGMRIDKADLRIDHVGEVGTAAMQLQLDGKLPDVFAFIAPPPVNINATRLGLDTRKIQGDAILNIGISLPTVKNLLATQVKVAVDGTLRHVLLPGMVHGLDVQADALKLQVGDGAASVAGQGKLDGHAVNFAWRQAMTAPGGQVQAALVLDNALLAHLQVPVADMLDGPVSTRIDYMTLAAGAATVDIQADATGAAITLPMLGYTKKAGAVATLQARARLQNGKLTAIENLTATAPALRVTNGGLDFSDGNLTAARLPQLQWNETQGAVTVAKNSGGAWQIDMHGPFADASPFLAQKTTMPYHGPAIMVHIVADQLRLNAMHILKTANVLVDRDADGLFNRVDVQAIAGAGPVKAQLLPDARGIMTLHLRASDAGAALQALNIYDNALGGTLQIDGAAVDAQHPHEISGTASLRDFRIVHGPVLARIISAISPLSLLKSLDGDGIGFATLQSNFTWAMRPAGDFLTLSNGRTSGNSLGLTFAGTIDKGQNVVKMDGNVIPLSGVNKLVGDIPLLGNLLTGSKNGAMFAATYTVSGPVNDPSVSVNPLSVLAPGIFRQILFGGETN